MVLDILRKEIKEIVATKRLLIIGTVFVVATTGLAVFTGHLLEKTPNWMLTSAYFVIILTFVPVLALILAYDTIVGERNKGSLSLLLSKPVGRSQIFAGKFLAIFLFTGVIFLIVTSFGYWLTAALSETIPSATEVAAAYKFFFAVLLVIACSVSFAMFFSTLFRSLTTSLVTTLILWITALPMISRMPVAYYFIYYLIDTQQGLVNLNSLGFEGVVLPGWVKVLYAVGPDPCIGEISGHLLGPFPLGLPMLTMGQSIAAMMIFFGVFFIPALLLFRRLSLE